MVDFPDSNSVDPMETFPFLNTRKMEASRIKHMKMIWLAVNQFPYFRRWSSPKLISRILLKEYEIPVSTTDISFFFSRANKIVLAGSGFVVDRLKVGRLKNRLWISRPSPTDKIASDPGVQHRKLGKCDKWGIDTLTEDRVRCGRNSNRILRKLFRQKRKSWFRGSCNNFLSKRALRL